MPQSIESEKGGEKEGKETGKGAEAGAGEKGEVKMSGEGEKRAGRGPGRGVKRGLDSHPCQRKLQRDKTNLVLSSSGQ